MHRVRQHCCNRYGAIYLKPEHYQLAYEEQIRQRDEALAADPSFSGEPAAFESWAAAQLQALVADPWYAEQVTRRAAVLEQETRLTLRQLERTAAELTAKVDALEAERQHLLSFIADE